MVGYAYGELPISSQALHACRVVSWFEGILPSVAGDKSGADPDAHRTNQF